MRSLFLPLLITLLGAFFVASCSGEDVALSGTMGTNEDAGHMLLRNVYVIAPEGDVYRPGDSAVVNFTVYNRSDRPDALIGARSGSARDVSLRWDRECDGEDEIVTQIPILPEGTAPNAAGDRAGGSPYYLEIEGLTEGVRPGTTFPVTFVFERAGQVQVDALVQVEGDRTVPPPPSCPVNP